VRTIGDTELLASPYPDHPVLCFMQSIFHLVGLDTFGYVRVVVVGEASAM
jgi:hypothetical protein